MTAAPGSAARWDLKASQTVASVVANSKRANPP